MSATKYILPETASFAAKLLNHKETDKSSPENLFDFTNPLASSTEAGYYTFSFKDFISKTYRLDSV